MCVCVCVCVCVYVNIDAVSKPYGKCKAKSTIYTHIKRKSNPSTTKKTVIQTQEKRGRKRREEKTYGNKPQTIKKMATGTYTLIITLNINRLKALTKRHKLTIDKENHIHTYAVYKRPRDTY